MTPMRIRFTLAVTVALVVTLAGTARALAPNYLRTIGPVSGPGYLGLPTGVTLGEDGDVFVSDLGSGILRFHPDGTFVSSWNPTAGLPGDGTAGAYGVESDGAGTLYVSIFGYGQGYIRTYDESGALLATYTTDYQGHNLGQPWGLSYTASQGLLIADGSRMWRLRGGLLSLLPDVGGCGPGQLNGASGLALIGTQLYETEYSDRLQRLDASNGSFVAELGSTAGCGQNRSAPRFVSRYDASHVVVVDMLSNFAEIVSTAGAVEATWGGTGSAHGSLNAVDDAVVAADGTIYLSDAYNHRIEVYGSGPMPTAAASWGQVKIRYH